MMTLDHSSHTRANRVFRSPGASLGKQQPNESLSEALVIQKILLALGGYDASPVFARIPPRSTFVHTLRLRDGVKIAHLSAGALRGPLSRFARYGSCAFALRRFLDLVSETGSVPGSTKAHYGIPSSLASILNDSVIYGGYIPSGYSCPWPPSVQGLFYGLRIIWDDWCLVLSTLHRRFVSSLHREFCGFEAIPAASTSSITLLEGRNQSQENTSPIFRLYLERFSKCNTHDGDHSNSAVSEFKVTLLNLEQCLLPFLVIMEEVTLLLDSILRYMDLYHVNIDSMSRVSTMLLLLQLRSSEHRQDARLSDLWQFLLHHTLSSIKSPLAFGDPSEAPLGDISWTYLGDAFNNLFTARDGVAQIYPEGVLPLSTYTTEWRLKLHKDVNNTEFSVLKLLNDLVTDSVRGTLRVLRNVLDDCHHLTAYLQFLSGICYLRFGDCLDPVFALLIRRPVPLNYEARVRSLIHEATMEWQRLSHGFGSPRQLSAEQVSQMVHSFTYAIQEAKLSPIVELKPISDHLGPLSRFFPESVMAKYSQILCHLLSFQMMLRDVKHLIRLTFRGSATFSGFFLPRATLLLLQICSALDHYYRWAVDTAWSSLQSQLGGCQSITDMLCAHNAYLDYVYECLLVPVGNDNNPTTRVNSLFSESLFLIHSCASELLRLCRSQLDSDAEEMESLYLVLKSEVTSMRGTLNVVCSLSLADVPTFGDEENRILSSVVRAGVDLNSSACHALAVLHRLLR
ncbi:gamma-tubulin complex component 5, putative [Babesia ovis]|uniref:Spindle pole body component n=1 Tax=Babesia ovis TaxID=5869 RepID=A0A9W5TBK0_BABOV|nr:gamma-tubulin complex component 5, putative [Babesia ovis]